MNFIIGLEKIKELTYRHESTENVYWLSQFSSPATTIIVAGDENRLYAGLKVQRFLSSVTATKIKHARYLLQSSVTKIACVRGLTTKFP